MPKSRLEKVYQIENKHEACILGLLDKRNTVAVGKMHRSDVPKRMWLTAL